MRRRAPHTFLSSDPPQIAAQRGPNRWLPWALTFVACALGLNALIGERGLAETLRARHEHRRALADLSALRSQNAALADRIERLRSDPRTIEGVARGDLGLMKKGEVLVLIKDVDQR